MALRAPLPAPLPLPLLAQVKYVVELAKALALHPAVYRVDLLTRLIRWGPPASPPARLPGRRYAHQPA